MVYAKNIKYIISNVLENNKIALKFYKKQNFVDFENSLRLGVRR